VSRVVNFVAVAVNGVVLEADVDAHGVVDDRQISQASTIIDQ
jgi:hypothetical protein